MPLSSRVHGSDSAMSDLYLLALPGAHFLDLDANVEPSKRAKGVLGCDQTWKVKSTERRKFGGSFVGQKKSTSHPKPWDYCWISASYLFPLIQPTAFFEETLLAFGALLSCGFVLF